ncbi:MAG: SDR family NAD(P)-dependent oxidoreductase [Desulfobacteraceae bacterium]|nr:SDR family NAD(P)-dependent oxidoreductase [Desulfobacteraceae bacterium]MBC2755220.1 SDR family NAD(P)-dependent oxidoreductase [Desulfobacteraceae bacterium]
MNSLKKIIITGACGFIGTCLSLRLLKHGIQVIGIDNLSRPGAELNAKELAVERKLFSLHQVDLSQTSKVYELFSSIGEVDAVFHLAGQVAVTSSYKNRQKDFINNVVVSFNVIEAVKRYTPEAYCLYASTNKVYGNITVNKPIGNSYPLNPYSPYGVSKAAAELYFTEYGRKEIGLATCSLRQSCIYGHHQYGIEDQGWVAWFSIANIIELPITIYGDGQQARDILFIEDLIDLYLECIENRVTGVYPVGGGVTNIITIKQALILINRITQKSFTCMENSNVRPGDQPYFVADTSWTNRLGLNWRPQVNAEQGIRKMIEWIQCNKNQIRYIIDSTHP